VVTKNVADTGAGLDTPLVLKDECSPHVVDTSTDTKPTAHPWSHAIVTTPDAIVLFYQEGASGLLMVYSADGGVSWSAPLVITTATDVYPSAVADICTQDIHVIYSEDGDPVIGDGHSVYHRALIYVGAPGLPAWNLGQEIEVAYGNPGIGYSNAVLSVQGRACDSTDDDDGRLMVLALRKTFTTRTWATFTATAPWTLQGAAESSAAVPTASGNERAAMAQQGGMAYALTFSGGLYGFYRSGDVAWGDASVAFTALDGFSGDNNEGFGLAVDYLGSLTTTLSGGSEVCPTVKEAAIAYVKDSHVLYREYSVPVGGTMSVVESVAWPQKNAYQATISRVGQYYRIAAIVATPAPTARSVIWADAPYFGSWYAIAEDASDEEWNWIGVPQHATSGYEWAAAWSETKTSAYNVYVGRCPIALYLMVCETGAGVDAPSLALPLTDTGVGADIPGLLLALIDAGAGADVPVVILAVADTGAGTEVIGRAVPLTDTGAGTDTAVIRVAVVDTGSGTEVAALIVSVTDTGSGADAIVNSPIVSVLDYGYGGDAATIGLSITDTGAGSDAVLLSIMVTDTGSGGETLTIVLNVTDAGAGVDAIEKNSTVIDAAVGADAVALAVGNTVGSGAILADSGTGTEEVTILLNVTDTGMGADAATMAVRVAMLVLRLLMERGRIRLRVKGPGA